MKPYQKTSPRVQPDNTRLVCHVFVDHPLNLEGRDCRPPRIQKQTKNPLPLQGKQSPRVRPSKSRIVCDVFGDRPPNLPRTYVRANNGNANKKAYHATGYKKGLLGANAYETLQETQPSRVQPGNNHIVHGNTIIAGSTRKQPYFM